MRQTVTVKSHFEAAHKLDWHQGKCYNLHGHTYQVKATIEGKINENGIIIDFKRLKYTIDAISEVYDHKYLNDLIPNPTVELTAQDYWARLSNNLYSGCKLVKLSISEGLDNYTEIIL